MEGSKANQRKSTNNKHEIVFFYFNFFVLMKF